MLAPVITLPAAPTDAALPAATNPTAADPFDQPVQFQASGWIEPDPYPIRASALISGTVDTVHILGGEHVRAGQALATLVDDDAKLDRATAQAAVRQNEAQLDAAIAQDEAAHAQLATLKLEVAAAEARLAELLDEAERLANIGTAAAPARNIEQARLRAESQRATIQALKSRRAGLEAEQRASSANRRQAENALAQARTELARRELALERTRIESPIDGVVQHLHVAPGMKRMLAMDDPESATIATLYQPQKLQARIDVPLETAAQIAVGQAVLIRSSLLRDTIFQGRVSRIEGQADIQRNTLQAKVTILDPDPGLRPEMLCRAEFLEAPAPENAGAASRSRGLALYVPESAILDGGDAPAVWKVDASGEHIVRQTIRTSASVRDGHLEVREGLKPGDRVVLNPAADLQSGDRVKAK